MTVAKGLGGGLPVGACVTTPDLVGIFQPGDHGSTFAGGPLIASAASAVLDVVDDDAFLDSVEAKGERLAGGLRGLGLQVRGAGSHAGVRLRASARSSCAAPCSSSGWC